MCSGATLMDQWPSSYFFPCLEVISLVAAWHSRQDRHGAAQDRKNILCTWCQPGSGMAKTLSLPCPLLPTQLWQHICTIKSNGDKWIHTHLWQYNKCISKGDLGFPAGQSQLQLQEKGKSPWRILLVVEATECSKWWLEAIMNLQHRGRRKPSKWKEKALAEKHNKWFFFFFLICVEGSLYWNWDQSWIY